MSSDKPGPGALRKGDLDVNGNGKPPAVGLHAGNLLGQTAANWRTGNVEAALLTARTVPAHLLQEAGQAYELGQILNACGELQGAEAAFRRAVELAPDELAYRKAHASALTTTGQAGAAEIALRALLTSDPGDAGLWYALAHNRVALSAGQLAEELQNRLGSASARDRVFLGYALGKCLEDTGRYEEAFLAYSEAAHLRRMSLQYDVTRDVSGIDALLDAFRSDLAPLPIADAGDSDDPLPIFVVGLPRSGTTLTERILTAHSAVTSIGEATIFTHCLSEALRELKDSDSGSRTGAVRRSMSIEMRDLGQCYMRRARVRAGNTAWFVDKMPLNFLYVGHICRALPDARIVLVRRNPLDSCWAMYSTLFNQAYPFSYDFREVAAYYAAFDRLASFWEERYEDRVFVLNYESLVERFEPTVRNLVQSCALPWQDACLRFHENAAPVATASVTQVRQPLYRSSVGRWRRFAGRLNELKDCLTSNGIPC